ncbi:MAG: ABC transporter permease [Jatrophihabitans sp.]|uniref:ABC transporter permease n=1 Tax=Jatrophihabitans sp. TaxID=1932789 RepID=UPI003F7D0FA4
MLTYLVRRTALAVPIVLVVATITFFFVQLVPGDPANLVYGISATREQVAALHQQLGIDRPVVDQYVTWLGHLLSGNLGTSFSSGQSVAQVLQQTLPVTLSLSVVATLFTVVLGVPVGMAAAVRGGRIDRTVTSIGSVAMAVPNFWLAAILILAFAVRTRLFPATGYVAFGDSPGQWLSHLVLPVVTIGLAGFGQVAFQTRAAVRDVLSREYVRTLHACGVPRRTILYKHVLRNAAIPVVAVVGLSFGISLGGVVVIEGIFNLQGMGSLMLNSVGNHDLPAIQGAVLAFSILVVLVNLGTDLAVAALNPRVRVG